ncbi:TPA: hypothetical protein J4313_004733, partial [Escherichia coli]|nr:hypothetical protein [Escherichia coli]HBB8508555.1 hypothetical protein [Escherichia coli]
HYRWPGWLERVNAAGLIRSMSRIDIRLGRFICGSSGWNITDHVMRYLILDYSPVPAATQEASEHD